MEETKPATESKDSVSSVVRCPMLNKSNYTVWAMRMKVVLRAHEVWETVEPGSKSDKKNSIATALIFQSIPENLILQIGELESPTKLWEGIKARHVGADRVKEARLQTLMAEFDKLQMKETESIDAFAGKLSEIASKSSSLGQAMDEPKLVKKFLQSLPPDKYIHIIASLEQVLDLNKTAFEDIVGRLKAYEERILAAKPQTKTDDQETLMFSNSELNENKGRGQSRGRGHGRDNSQNQNKEKRDKSEITCFRCDKTGHFASVCPDRKKKEDELNKNETEVADAALFMHEIVFLNESKVMPKKYETAKKEEGVWYLDNGASNHMTGERSYFSELNGNIKGKVKFGDGSFVDINGKGSILFQAKTGEQKLLKDVYYIPELRSNILSLGQATEQGCDVRMKDNYLILRDLNGRLLAKVFRYPNRLYKISLKVGEPVCLLTKLDEDDGRSTTGHMFFFGETPITWCSQKQQTVALSSCEAEFMAATEAAKQAIWLQDLLSELMGQTKTKTMIRIDNKSAIELTRNPVFHGRSKHIHKRYHFIRECIENDQIEVEHVPGTEQRADILTKALARIKFKEMRSLIGVQDISKSDLKLKGENVG